MKQEFTTPDEHRGYFISEFAKLERVIDLYFAHYFIRNDNPKFHNELISILVDRIPFESKRTALKAILDLLYVDKSAHNGGKKAKEFRVLLEEIGKMARIRNYYAHYLPVPIPEEELAIALVQFRDSVNIIAYTKEEFNNQIKQINKCAEIVANLRRELNNESAQRPDTKSV